MYNKIQPEQIEIHTFSSPSGSISFTKGSNYIYGNLSNNLTGNFNITGSLIINGSNLYTTDVSNSYTLTNNVILGGRNNTVSNGFGNAIINSSGSSVQGQGNLDLNSISSIFNSTSRFSTILAGKNNSVLANIYGSSIISDVSNISTIADQSNKFYVNFTNGTDFQGNVEINNDLLLNANSNLLLHSNASAVFSGDVTFLGNVNGINANGINGGGIVDYTYIVTKTGQNFITGNKIFQSELVANQNFVLSGGSNVNGTSDYPSSSSSNLGEKGRFAYVDNNLFIKNDGRWIKFFGSTGDWEGFDLNTGGLKLTTVLAGGSATTVDLASWGNGLLSQSSLGVKEIRDFPSFGGFAGSLIIPTTGGVLSTIEWQNGLITSTGLFTGALSGNITAIGGNGKNGSFIANGSTAVSWSNGFVTNTGDLTGTFLTGNLKTGSLNILTPTGTQTINWEDGQITTTGNSYISLLSNSIVYTTGDQLISGLKTFNQRPFVNGTGVLLVGEAGESSLPIVYRTGDQLISGLKTFSQRPFVNGTGVLLVGEAAGATSLPTTIVYQTGSQSISGSKFLHSTLSIINTGFSKIFLGSGASNGIEITSSAPVNPRIYNIPDVGGNCQFLMSTGNQNIGGTKNFTTAPTLNGTDMFFTVPIGASYQEQSFSFVDEYGYLVTKIFLVR